jgi:hypothetical protein
MGLLDDAIREHMELKRLRGGDPTVIARQEQDALGPVLHEQNVPEDAAAHVDEDAVPHLGNAPEDAAAHVDEDAAAHMENAPEDAVPHVETPALQAPEDVSSQDPQSAQDPDFANVGEETAELDMRTVLDEQHEAADRAGQIDSAGLAVAPDESGEPVEDVLEETPDFLRETPEQERLWFEQQPPRDFDFDK